MPQLTYNCETCGKENTKYWQPSLRKPRFCNVSCSNVGNERAQGKRPKETRRRMSEARLGKKLSEDHRQKISESNLGEKNHFYGKKHSDESKRKMSEARLGEKNHFYGKHHSIDHRQKISKANCGDKHPLFGKKLPEESRHKLSKTMSEGIASGRIKINSGTRGTYESLHGPENYDSLYELTRMKFLDSDPKVRDWTKKHGITISYFMAGKERNYVPDFLIELKDKTIILDEVKGFIRDEEIFEVKCRVAKAFCEQYDWKYQVTFKEGLEEI